MFTARYELNLKIEYRIMEALVRTHANPCGIFGGKSDTGTGFSPNTSAFSCQYESTNAPDMSLLLEGHMEAAGEPSFFGFGRAIERKLILPCLQRVKLQNFLHCNLIHICLFCLPFRGCPGRFLQR
jgi:hypothetical protein